MACERDFALDCLDFDVCVCVCVCGVLEVALARFSHRSCATVPRNGDGEASFSPVSALSMSDSLPRFSFSLSFSL